MKKCPYCAEEIQDAAIVCKHCGRELDAEAVGKLSSKPQTPPQIEEAEPTFSVDGIEMLYAGLLAGVRKMKPKEIDRYPLSVNRRPRVIAEGLVMQLEDDPRAVNLFLRLWWTQSTFPKDIKKGEVEDWATKAEKRLDMDRLEPGFPTEDEWLSIAAAALVVVNQSPRVSLTAMDLIDAWRSLAKARKADRILRGITIVGAMANLATAFSAPKPPKQGKWEWHVRRRACAQVEAASLLLVE